MKLRDSRELEELLICCKNLKPQGRHRAKAEHRPFRAEEKHASEVVVSRREVGCTSRVLAQHTRSPGGDPSAAYAGVGGEGAGVQMDKLQRSTR